MNDSIQAYLIRLQRVKNEDSWCGSIEGANTGEIIRFANERDLLVHLMCSLKPENQPKGNGIRK